jgi:quercetin dioxygenase-like cupin family protein
LQAGEAFQVPANTPHSAKNGAAKTILSSTYIVEKGKPLASPA